MKRSIEERFWSKVNYSGPVPSHLPFLGPCWNWVGSVKSTGYGQFSCSGKMFVAHRWVWENAHGKIPSGLNCLHRCDNKACVKPEHLFLGTAKDNALDMVSKGRQNPRPGCFAMLKVRATARGELIGISKLVPSDVFQIRKRLAQKESCRSIARSFGVHHSVISDIKRNKTWRHLAAHERLIKDGE